MCVSVCVCPCVCVSSVCVVYCAATCGRDEEEEEKKGEEENGNRSTQDQKKTRTPLRMWGKTNALSCTPELHKTAFVASPQTRWPFRARMALSDPKGPSGLEGGAGALDSGGDVCGGVMQEANPNPVRLRRDRGAGSPGRAGASAHLVVVCGAEVVVVNSRLS